MRRQIDPAEVGRFSIDDNNRLFWDDEQIHTEVSLSRKQSIWAIVVAIAAILGALATSVNTATNVWSTFFKKTPALSRQSGADGNSGATRPSDVPPRSSGQPSSNPK